MITTQFELVHLKKQNSNNLHHLLNCKCNGDCGSNAFQDYFDDAKKLRVNQVSRIIKIKIQDSREDSIKVSTKKVFQNIE